MFPVNIAAVLIAAVVSFFIGFLFHGPFFGKLWMKLANVRPTGKEKMSDMVPAMIKNLLVNVIFAYFLAVVILFAANSPFGWGGGVVNGMLCAVIVWLGFVITTTSIEVIWMKRSYKLWLFECVASLVACLAMGAIIGAW